MIRRGRRAAATLLVVLLAACGGGDGDEGDAASALEGPISTRPSDDAADAAVSQSTLSERAPGSWALATEDLANAAGSPRMLVSDGDRIMRVDRGVPVEVADPERRVGRALGDGDGQVVYEELERDADGVEVSVRLIRRDADGTTAAISTGDHASVQLHDLFRMNGRAAVIYARFVDPDEVDDDVTGRLVVQDLSTGDATVLADAAGPELFLSHASAAAGLLALTYVADLTEVVEFRDWSGALVERESPTDGLAYNQAPFVTGAVLSPDGSEVATVEGPDVDGTSGDGDTQVGDWQVVIDDADGEQLRFTVADQSIAYVTIDFDGRWLLVSGGTVDGPVAPLLIDTEATDLAAYLVAGVVGEAQLESLAGG